LSQKCLGEIYYQKILKNFVFIFAKPVLLVMVLGKDDYLKKKFNLKFYWLNFFFKNYREFIAKNYVSLKEANPNFPILVRESSGVEARFFARYGNENK